MRVASVQADADFRSLERAKDPKQVSDLPSEKVREHILQHQSDLQLAAVHVCLVEDAHRVLHSCEPLVVGYSRRFGPGVDHEMADFENCCCVCCVPQFPERFIPHIHIRGSNINAFCERSMKRVTLHSQLAYALGSPLNQPGIVIVEMSAA